MYKRTTEHTLNHLYVISKLIPKSNLAKLEEPNNISSNLLSRSRLHYN